jgi:hypothetical protein
MKLSLILLSNFVFGFDNSDYNYADTVRFGSVGSNQIYGSTGSNPDATQNLSPARENQSGHGHNRRYCHTTGSNRRPHMWTSLNGGYFAEGRNRIECVGEDLYCFIEERAQFGQITQILAGCEQMMNHPGISSVDQATLANHFAIRDFYNKEAARGMANVYSGLGGCLAVAAQNGQNAKDTGANTVGVDSGEFNQAKENNGHRFGNMFSGDMRNSFALNQCLRFRSSMATDAGPTNLLPFGVSVCRACCLAQFNSVDPHIDPDAITDDLCNYPPDTDAIIASMTSDTSGNSELLPRFDMKQAAGNDFSYGMLDGRDNNLFIHDGFSGGSGAGRGRGCTFDSGFSCDNS